MKHASYLRKVFKASEQTKVINDVKEIIKQKQLKFDGFVVIGVSGIVLGSILSRVLKKDLVIVRKDSDGSHSSYSVENYDNGKRYIFFDDLIASGNTYQNMMKSFELCHTTNWLYGDSKQKSKIIGTILYDPMDTSKVTFYTPQALGGKYKSKVKIN